VHRLRAAASTAIVIVAALAVPLPNAAQDAASSPVPRTIGTIGAIDRSQLPRTVGVRDVADHLVVDVAFGADGPHAFMLDTGAPTDLVETLRDRVGGPTIAEIQAAAVGGARVTQELFPIEAMTIDGLEVTETVAIEGWVGPDNPLSCITENGLIGANAMADAVWQIDYQAGAATVASSTEGLEHIDGAITLDFQPTPGLSPTPIVAIPYGPAGFIFVVDSGSDAGLIAPPDQLTAAGIEVLTEAPTEHIRATGAAGSIDLTARYVPTRLELGGVAMEYPIAAVDIGTQGLGNMGNAFLSQFIVTFDWAGRKLYLDPVAEDGAIDPPERPSAGLGWDGSRIFVHRLLVGSPAAEAGLRLGDVVSAVDGRDVSQATRGDFCALMTGARPSAIRTGSGATYDIAPMEDFFGG
jgi:PDZ domain